MRDTTMTSCWKSILISIALCIRCALRVINAKDSSRWFQDSASTALMVLDAVVAIASEYCAEQQHVGRPFGV